MNKHSVNLHNAEITALGIHAIQNAYQTMAIASQEYPGLLGVATGCDSPFLNVVIDTRTNQEADLHLPELKNFFDQHHVSWLWMATSLADHTAFKKSGLTLLEKCPSMYFDLRNHFTMIDIPDFVIEQLDTNDDLSRWIKPLCEAFPSDDSGEAFRHLNAKLLQKGETKLQHFIGLHKNQVVTAGTLFLSDYNSVMLHNIATKPSQQRQGFGKAMTLHLMQQAKALEFTHCFLDSSDEGFSLYQKLGFMIYAMLGFYRLTH